MSRALIDFTLSNARRFYSSMGNSLDGKGLTACALCIFSRCRMRKVWGLQCLILGSLGSMQTWLFFIQVYFWGIFRSLRSFASSLVCFTVNFAEQHVRKMFFLLSSLFDNSPFESDSPNLTTNASRAIGISECLWTRFAGRSLIISPRLFIILWIFLPIILFKFLLVIYSLFIIALGYCSIHHSTNMAVLFITPDFPNPNIFISHFVESRYSLLIIYYSIRGRDVHSWLLPALWSLVWKRYKLFSFHCGVIREQLVLFYDWTTIELNFA